MGNTAFVENCDRSQFLKYSKLKQYLCTCLKLLKRQRGADQNVLSTEMIKSERVCILMEIVHSRKVEDAK